MYANRFTGESRFHPAGLAAAIGINAAVIAALMIAAPHVTMQPAKPPLLTENIPLPPPVTPPPPEALARTDAQPTPPRLDNPVPVIKTPPTSDTFAIPVDPLPPIPAGSEAGPATGGGTAILPPVPLPVILGPALDPRYARDLQPAYPAAERRMGTEGKVTVRVLIGTDGRVKRVERVAAASDAFFRATEEQALRRWRFTPGTRDGVPQEAWQTMSVTFVMTD